MSSSLASELQGLVTNLPPGVSPYPILIASLENSIFAPPTGYWLFQTYLFIAIHALIAVVSIAGCYVRHIRGNCWFFRRRNGYICPNTSILSQFMFACYSILFIVALCTNELMYPSVAEYAISLAAYIPLGLAIHIQTWSTIYARPSVTGMNSASSPIHTGTPWRRLGPRSLNAIMITVGVVFTLSIIIGRILATIVREKMMKSWNIIRAGLELAEANNAPLTSLFILLPAFKNLEFYGKKLRHVELTLGKVWSFWAGFWILTYVPTAFLLYRTLRRQQNHLKRSLNGLNVLDDLVTQEEFFTSSPSISRNPSRSSYIPLASSRSKSNINLDLSSLPPPPPPVFKSEKEVNASLEKLPQVQSIVSSPHSSKHYPSRRISTRLHSGNVKVPVVSRTAIQKEEVLGKLNSTKRMKEVILYQLIATTIMLITYTAILIFTEQNHFQDLDPLAQIHITDSWLGWAFAGPALFSSAGFLYVSLKAPKSTRLVLQDQNENEDSPKSSSEPIRPNFITSRISSFNANATSTYKSSPRTSKSSFSQSDSIQQDTRRFTLEENEMKELDLSEGSNNDETKAGNKNWVPSRWVIEKEERVKMESRLKGLKGLNQSSRTLEGIAEKV